MNIDMRSDKTNLLRLCFLYLCLSLNLGLASMANAQEFSAMTNRNEVSLNESLTLTLRYKGNSNAAPDLAALSRDFEVISQNQSSQYRNFNGRIESFTDWVITLMPLREGQLTIPPITLDGARSQAITITVNEEKSSPAANNRSVFLETELEKSESYVQEQIKITFRLYFSVNIEALDREQFTLENVLIEELPEVKYRRKVNGNPYTVVEFSYAMYPQTSGSLTIPSMNWDTRLNRANRRDIYNFGTSRSEIKRLKTEEKQLVVQAQPSQFPQGATWLPSTQLTLTETWSKDPDNMTAGEPLTRTVTLHAQGLNSSQLPAIAEDIQSNTLKFYQEQPQLNDEKNTYGINSTRTEKYAVVAKQAGELTVPSIRLPWWNVKSQRVEYAEIPSRTITVAAGATANEPKLSALPPALNPDAGDTLQPSSEKQGYWQALAYASLFATVIFIGLWLHSRNQLQKLKLGNTAKRGKAARKREMKESAAFNAIRQACNAGDSNETRRCILQWLAIFEGRAATQSLNAFLQNLSDATLKSELEKLDAALYSSSTSPQSLPGLYKALEAYRASHRQHYLSQSDVDLPPLYN